MFEAVELGARVSREDYEAALPGLRVRLLEAQHAAREALVPVVVVLAGDDRQAVNEGLNRLHEWMNASGIEAHALGLRGEEARTHPFFWRYWVRLPARGRMGVFAGGWPSAAIAERLRGRLGRRRWDRRLDHLARFEEELVADGAAVLKLWLHLPRAELAKRLKRSRKHPREEWFVSDQDRDVLDRYGDLMDLATEVVRRTSRADARWHLIESTDRRHANLELGVRVAEAIEEAVGRARSPREAELEPDPETAAEGSAPEDPRTALDRIDLSCSLRRSQYKKRLERGQARLHELVLRAHEHGQPTVLVFEGWDAAGKGGAIRRLTLAMPATLYRVVRVGSPSPEELAHHYLWRFWRNAPPDGHVRIFDRSWYGRVLVERVEGFARPDEWRRAYAEINDFEEQLCEHGARVLKFWLEIDPDEQLRRFRDREQRPWKHFKITDEDWRNRARREDYERAAGEMVQRTSTDLAPWHLVAANDKRHARVTVLEAVCGALERDPPRARRK